jgi:alpha-mannosidase
MVGDIEQFRRDLAALAAGRSRPAERLAAELEFAEGLSRLHPDKARRWDKLIREACAAAASAVKSGRLDRLEQGVQAAETILAPVAKVAKQYTVHCVGHAHIDMNWLWSWPETVAVTNDTFQTVLKLMDEFPDFCFTQSQASVYALLAEHNPDLLEAIRRRVAEGRWEVAAVQWVEGDKNIAAGEALARHLLYTRRYLKEIFDLDPEDATVEWEPDTFGHAHTIPTIIAAGGVRHYYMCRGGLEKKPPVFWWQGPDGSRVLVNLETTWYLGPLAPKQAAGLLGFCEKTGLKDWMTVYGVGDHGGGPTRRDILRGREMDSWPVYPNFRFATARSYYKILEAEGTRWPVLDRELNFVFSGCYTSQSVIKHATRFGENYCLEAETAAALARRITGRKYPAAALREAWINTLFGHFHDILPGSCVRASRDYQAGLFQKTAATTGIIKTESLRALAARVDTSFAGQAEPASEVPGQESTALGGGPGRGAMIGGMSTVGHVTDGPRAFLVYNPTAWPRQEVVTATLWDVEAADAVPKSFIVRTPDGRTLPTQRLTAGDYWGHRFVEVAFPVSVGPLGYAAYVVDEGAAPAPADPVTFRGEKWWDTAPTPTLALENDRLSLVFDRLSGGLIQCLDKASGRDLASAANPAAVLEYFVERPHRGTAWIIGDLKSRTGPLPLDYMGMDQRGPYVATIVSRLKIGQSEITITHALKHGHPGLEITLQARWLERGTPETGVPMLRLSVPLALEDARARYEIPFGWIERPHHEGEEVPALRWADATGKQPGGREAGCTLLNDSKYGYSLDGSTLRLTLIRSSYDPDPLPEIGDHTIRMALLPHGKAPAPADLVRQGAAFNHPLLVVATDVHKGDLAAAGAAVTVERADHIVVTSLKAAEDGDSLVFRLMETAGKKTTARIRLAPDLMGTAAEAVETDFLERPLPSSSAKATKDGFSVTVPARGIASVKVTFAK